MTIRVGRPLVVGVAALLAPLLGAAVIRSDVVTLKTGGVVRGQLAAPQAHSGKTGDGKKTVSVTTPGGARIELDSKAVQQVKREAAGAPRLTPAEHAWLSKVSRLVSRLADSDRRVSRKARAELLRIDDRNAIPALARHLAPQPNEEARRLFVVIMRNMPGSTTVYYLVATALYDPSPLVRDEARRAIGPQRADAARPLFIRALRSGDPRLATMAAQGISEVGDPQGDAVPYLIDAVAFRGRTVNELPTYSVFGHSLDPTCSPSRAITLMYGRVPPRCAILDFKQGNPVVLDALVKITDQKYPGFGIHTDTWHRWWAAERLNRAKKKSRADDHVVQQVSTPR